MRRPSKVDLFGFTIVRLPDACTREARKFYREGILTAVLQKNGNIGISHSGIFDDATHPRNRFKVAKCLHGLGLIGNAILLEHRDRANTWERHMDVTSLASEAESLGYKIVELPKAKTVKRTCRNRTRI